VLIARDAEYLDELVESEAFEFAGYASEGR
jgi:hypothetical protein